MRWQYVAAVACGIPVGFYLGLVYAFFQDERPFTKQQVRLDNVMTLPRISEGPDHGVVFTTSPVRQPLTDNWYEGQDGKASA